MAQKTTVETDQGDAVFEYDEDSGVWCQSSGPTIFHINHRAGTREYKRTRDNGKAQKAAKAAVSAFSRAVRAAQNKAEGK